MNSKTYAWLAHAYTALGLIAGLLALRAFLDGSLRQSFGWLAVATIIDSTDGPLARRLRASELIPWFNGRRLDDIVDYINYVLIPVLMMALGGLLPEREWAWGSIPALSSAYGFCREDSKTDDGFFTGFPSYWNIVAFHLYALHLPHSVNLAVILILSALIFIPIKYIDPFKTKPLRRLTIPLTIAWGCAMLVLVATMRAPNPTLIRLSLIYCAYYIIASFWIHLSEGSLFRRGGARPPNRS